MNKSTSWYPSLSVGQCGSGVVSHAGAVLLARAADRTGLTRALSTALAPHCTACSIDVEPRRREQPSDHAPVIATLSV